MKVTSLMILVLTAANVSFAAQKQDQKQTEQKTQEERQAQANKIFYITAKMNVDLLQAKADKGDMASALAVFDFYENVKDANYKIDYPDSKKLLQSLALLDGMGKVHNATREAFKQYGNIK